MFRNARVAYVGCVLLIGRAAAAQDQPTLIVPPQKVTGNLGRASSHLVGGKPFRMYRFNAEAGARYTISVHSAAFDALLKIGVTQAGLTEYIADDDDSGPGLDSFLRWKAPAKNQYLIVVTTASTDTGSYDLEIKQPPAPVVTPVAIGDSAVGRFNTESPTTESNGTPYELYAFRAQRGRPLRITVLGDSIGTLLSLGHAQGTEFTSLANAYGKFEPVQYFVPPDDSDFAIEVIGAKNTIGRYVVKLSPIASLPDTSGSRTVVLGKDMKGFLIGNGTRRHTLGTAYQDWTFSAREGQRLRIDLRSTQFDTYLVLGRRLSGGDFAPKDTSDDAPGQGDNSGLDFSVPATGEYVLRVRADWAGGEYTLRVDEEAPRRLSRNTAVVGQDIPGTLGAMDALLDDGSPYQEWTIQANAGDRLTITMTSPDFDTFLSVGQLNGNKYVEWSANDDAAEETLKKHVSRVVIAPQKAGEFVVRANSVNAIERGSYTLRVEKTHGVVQATR